MLRQLVGPTKRSTSVLGKHAEASSAAGYVDLDALSRHLQQAHDIMPRVLSEMVSTRRARRTAARVAAVR